MLPHRPPDRVHRKSLAQQRLDDPAPARWIVQRHTSSKPPGKRRAEQRRFIDCPEDLGHRVGRDAPSDPDRGELSQHAITPLPLDRRMRASEGSRDPRIIQESRCLQSFQGAFDGRRCVPAADEAVVELATDSSRRDRSMSPVV